MLISTKGYYALKAMIDLAEQPKSGYIPLKEIAERQNISQKYLESIMAILSRNNFIEALHGKGGGYCLNRSPKDYRVGDILRLMGKTLAPVSCLDCDVQSCAHATECKMLPMWENLDETINSFLDNISISDLMSNEQEYIDKKQ